MARTARYARASMAIVGGLLAIAHPVAAQAAQVKLAATLKGANEPAGGDPKGSGTFKVEIDADADAGDFCYSLSGAGIGKPTMAHVNSGAAGADGPSVIPIDVADDECRAVKPELLKQIVAAPGSYFVTIQTAAYPKGAVRGQLEVTP